MNVPDIVHLGEGTPRGFDVAAIENDIRSLWKSAGEDGAHAVSRACLANLIVPVAGDADVQDLVEDVTRLQPSRVIIVRLHATRAPGPIQAYVSGTCTRRPGEALVCSESITLETGPSNRSAIPGAIRSLVVGNLPRTLLVENLPFTGLDWIPALGRSLDTVLADAATLEPAEGLALWRRCLAGDRPPCRDLVWTRLVDWRRALAMVFDPPGEAGLLRRIRRVEVEIADPPTALPGTALLLGWLAARLGWKATPEGPVRFTAADGPVEIRVRAVPPSRDPARIRSVTVSFDGAAPKRWRRLSTQRAIEIETGHGARRLNQSKTSRASAIVTELHHHHGDPNAGAAMRVAAAILERLEAGE